MLIKHLPRDSALTRELHGEAADWSTTDYLLANVVDHLAVANWMFATINRDEEADPLDPPEPTVRPGQEEDADAVDAEPVRAGASKAEVASFFGSPS